MGMRCLVAVALMVAGVMLPACAQRGGSHGGGFSGHGASGFRGGSSGSVSRGFASSSGSGGNRFVSRQGSYARSAVGVGRYRPQYAGSWRYRRPYERPYHAGDRYGYPVTGGSYLLGYPYDFGFDDSQAPQDTGSEGYATQPDDQGPPDANYPPYLQYPAYPAPSVQQQAPAPADGEDAVTLVFKDGRAPEQIHNYVLTGKTLYVGDRQRREIPINELDLTATAKVNHDAGVEFHLPNSSN